MDIKKNVGKKIAYLRKIQGYSQEKFAEIISINVSSLSGIETGKSFPAPQTFEKIIEKLKIKPQDLFSFETANEEEIYKDTYKNLIEKIKLFRKDKEKINLIYAVVKSLL